jgi:xylulokinase
MVEQAGPEPTDLVYFPYLLGSGTPHADQHVKAAFIGLTTDHTRAHLAKSVLEGAAYELEFIRRAAERGTGVAIDTIIAAGGGTRSSQWMQIKADVGGHNLQVSSITEATVLGAALLAGIGCGMYRDSDEALRHIQTQKAAVFIPNQERHQHYRHVYEHVYEPLQQPLRQVAQRLAEKGTRAA